MKYLATMLALLMLSSTALADSTEVEKLKSWKATVQAQLAQDKNELGQWKVRIANLGLLSVGKSPIGFTHTVPGQDPTNVGTWRDPLTKADVPDSLGECQQQMQRLEDSIKAAEQELSSVDGQIKQLENVERGGSEGGGGGGGGSGGGY